MSGLRSASTSPPSLSWADRPGRALLKLAWPITVSVVSFSTMTLASTAFVARIGADELAGVGLASVVGFTLVCFGIGLLRGAKTLVSQAVGAGRADRIPELLGAALGLALALGILATVAGQLVAPLLASLTRSARAGHFASQYLDGIIENSPPFKAWMGGLVAMDYGVFSVSDTLYQDVAVPAHTTQVRLTGMYEVRTAETEATMYDSAQLALTQTDGTPLQVMKDLTNLTPTTAWTAIDTLATQNLAGQTVRVRITTTNDVVNPTSFYFDTLALTATICQ